MSLFGGDLVGLEWLTQMVVISEHGVTRLSLRAVNRTMAHALWWLLCFSRCFIRWEAGAPPDCWSFRFQMAQITAPWWGTHSQNRMHMYSSADMLDCCRVSDPAEGDCWVPLIELYMRWRRSEAPRRYRTMSICARGIIRDVPGVDQELIEEP